MHTAKSNVFKLNDGTRSEVYTLCMPKFVYVQVVGIETPAKIRSDKVEEDGDNNGQITLSNNGQFVGKFNKMAVQGWWIQEESESR